MFVWFALEMDAKLLNACALLLGPHVRRRGPTYLQSLDVAAVRRAYRVMAVASHPDAVRRSGAQQGQADGKCFIEASLAYELLMGYLLNRKAGGAPTRATRPRAEPGRTARRAGGEKRGTGEKKGAGDKRAASDKRSAGDKRGASDKPSGGERRSSRAVEPLFYRGPMPRRRLRLAEFLYYTGRVSWQSLIAAIVWQRASQPRFGELARELQDISSQDLARILGSRLRKEQTGQAAQRLRILTSQQVERILRMQRARRRMIGRYFIEKESMSSAMLSTILREMYRHNARFAKPE
jgi:hypothetical protein